MAIPEQSNRLPLPLINSSQDNDSVLVGQMDEIGQTLIRHEVQNQSMIEGLANISDKIETSAIKTGSGLVEAFKKSGSSIASSMGLTQLIDTTKSLFKPQTYVDLIKAPFQMMLAPITGAISSMKESISGVFSSMKEIVLSPFKMIGGLFTGLFGKKEYAKEKLEEDMKLLLDELVDMKRILSDSPTQAQQRERERERLLLEQQRHDEMINTLENIEGDVSEGGKDGDGIFGLLGGGKLAAMASAALPVIFGSAAAVLGIAGGALGLKTLIVDKLMPTPEEAERDVTVSRLEQKGILDREEMYESWVKSLLPFLEKGDKLDTSRLAEANQQELEALLQLEKLSEEDKEAVREELRKKLEVREKERQVREKQLQEMRERDKTLLEEDPQQLISEKQAVIQTLESQIASLSAMPGPYGQSGEEANAGQIAQLQKNIDALQQQIKDVKSETGISTVESVQEIVPETPTEVPSEIPVSQTPPARAETTKASYTISGLEDRQIKESEEYQKLYEEEYEKRTADRVPNRNPRIEARAIESRKKAAAMAAKNRYLTMISSGEIQPPEGATVTPVQEPKIQPVEPVASITDSVETPVANMQAAAKAVTEPQTGLTGDEKDLLRYATNIFDEATAAEQELEQVTESLGPMEKVGYDEQLAAITGDGTIMGYSDPEDQKKYDEARNKWFDSDEQAREMLKARDFQAAKSKQIASKLGVDPSGPMKEKQEGLVTTEVNGQQVPTSLMSDFEMKQVNSARKTKSSMSGTDIQPLEREIKSSPDIQRVSPNQMPNAEAKQNVMQGAVDDMAMKTAEEVSTTLNNTTTIANSSNSSSAVINVNAPSTTLNNTRGNTYQNVKPSVGMNF